MAASKILLTSKAFLDLDACVARGDLAAPLAATLKARFAELYTLQASHAEAERDALSSYSTLSVHLDDARAELPVSAARREEAVEALAVEDAEREELRAATAALKQREADTLDRNADLASRLELAQQELEAASEAVAAEVAPLMRALAEEAEEAASEAAAAGAALEATEAALVNARMRGEALRRQGAKHTATLEALRAELAAAQREPAKIALQMEGVERLYAGVATEVARTEGELGACAAAVAAQEGALSASAHELAGLKARLVTHTAEVAAREAEVAACEALVVREKANGRALTEQRLALEDEAEAGLAAAAAARAALASASTAYEKARKALKRAQESGNEARAELGVLSAAAAAKEVEVEGAAREARAAAATQAALAREMDVLVAQYLREEAGEKKGRAAVAELAAACAAAEKERAAWAAEEGVAVKQLAALKAARDLKQREGVRLAGSLREVLASAEALEAEAGEAQALLAALARSEAHTYKLYELAGSEVSALASAEAQCSAGCAQLLEQRNLLASEVAVLTSEHRAKTRAHSVEEMKRDAAREARDKLQERLNTVRLAEAAAGVELETALLQLGGLSRSVDAAKRNREVATRARTDCELAQARAGSLLADVREELSALWEKLHAQEAAKERGERALSKLTEEVAALTVCRQELQGALNSARERGKRAGNEGEVALLESQLAAARARAETLSAAITNPRGRFNPVGGAVPEEEDLKSMVCVWRGGARARARAAGDGFALLHFTCLFFHRPTPPTPPPCPQIQH